MTKKIFSLCCPLLFPLKHKSFFRLALAVLVSIASARAQQQQQPKPATPPTTTIQITEPQLVRTSTKTFNRRFGYGGTLTVTGAPRGNIIIEGWNKNEIELTADVEVRAYTEEDLARLATVNTFLFDEDFNHLRVTTTGMNDKKYLRTVAKDFPKRLLTMPWKIDYRLHVPAMTDLRIYAGQGELNISGVEGVIQIEGTDTKAQLAMSGGVLRATVARGSVELKVGARSWRGNGAMIQLAAGDVSVELPVGFNADIDATILRTGRIDNKYQEITPQQLTTPTERSIRGRTGQGGATLSLTVGDGTINIKPAAPPPSQ